MEEGVDRDRLLLQPWFSGLEDDLAEVGRLRAEVGCAIERIAMRALIGV